MHVDTQKHSQKPSCTTKCDAAVCCSVLQRVAQCYDVLRCVAVCGDAKDYTPMHIGVLQCGTGLCAVVYCESLCLSVLQCVAMCCNVLQCSSSAMWCMMSARCVLCHSQYRLNIFWHVLTQTHTHTHAHTHADTHGRGDGGKGGSSF